MTSQAPAREGCRLAEPGHRRSSRRGAPPRGWGVRPGSQRQLRGAGSCPYGSDAIALRATPGAAGRRFTTAMPVNLRPARSEEHTSELQSLAYLVCRLLLEKKKKNK